MSRSTMSRAPRGGTEREPARVPLAVYLLLAGVLLAVVAHGVVMAQPRRCVAWQERPSTVMTEARP